VNDNVLLTTKSLNVQHFGAVYRYRSCDCSVCCHCWPLWPH